MPPTFVSVATGIFLSTLPVRGSPGAGNAYIAAYIGFLSTLPVRGATPTVTSTSCTVRPFLSTLPVRGATQIVEIVQLVVVISIHAPREGSD